MPGVGSTADFWPWPRVPSELGCRPRQQLPVLALLLPVHQDVQVLGDFLSIGLEFLLTDKVEAHDGGWADDTDRRVFVFKRRPFVICVGDSRRQRGLVVECTAGV